MYIYIYTFIYSVYLSCTKMRPAPRCWRGEGVESDAPCVARGSHSCALSGVSVVCPICHANMAGGLRALRNPIAHIRHGVWSVTRWRSPGHNWSDRPGSGFMGLSVQALGLLMSPWQDTRAAFSNTVGIATHSRAQLNNAVLKTTPLRGKLVMNSGC